MSFIKQKLLFVGAVLILILAAVAFVFIPALGGSASGKILEFGKWNGKPIEYIEDTFFVRQFQYMANSLQEQGGELDQFNHYRIMRSAFSAAVLRLAILDELESAGYRPSQALINRYLLPTTWTRTANTLREYLKKPGDHPLPEKKSCHRRTDSTAIHRGRIRYTGQGIWS